MNVGHVRICTQLSKKCLYHVVVREKPWEGAIQNTPVRHGIRKWSSSLALSSSSTTMPPFLSHSLPPSKNMFSQHFSLLISPLSHPRLPPSSNVRCKTTTANVNLYSLLAAVLSSCYQRSQTTSSTLDGFFNFLRKASEKKWFENLKREKIMKNFSYITLILFFLTHDYWDLQWERRESYWLIWFARIQSWWREKL